MRKQDYEKANNQFKDTISCMYVDSFGKSKGTQYNHVGAIVLNQVVDCFLKKNNFRILCKNNNAIINLNDKNYYFFFAMEGDCKIKITYPYFKWFIFVDIISQGYYHISIKSFLNRGFPWFWGVSFWGFIVGYLEVYFGEYPVWNIRQKFSFVFIVLFHGFSFFVWGFEGFAFSCYFLLIFLLRSNLKLFSLRICFRVITTSFFEFLVISFWHFSWNYHIFHKFHDSTCSNFPKIKQIETT